MPEQAQPIAFRVEPAASDASRAHQAGGEALCLQTRTRALSGMQKVALVEHGPTGTAWRLLCDEGPWLNGTDLAPFPLGYFAAGLASCFLSDIRSEAVNRAIALDRPNLRLDIFFTMEGSILRGTMAAGVDSINLTVAGREADDAALEAIVSCALEGPSVMNRTLAARLPSRFSLRVNGQAVEWPGERVRKLESATDPAPAFARLQPARQARLSEPIIRKDTGSSGGAGGQGAVGLQSEQKRSVHVQAEARLREDGLHEIAVRCVQPAGSRFVFLGEDSIADREGRAPCGLTYLSAGLAFCFMTQLGRYAQIRKLPLRGYRIVQYTSFGGESPSPVETAVFLDSDDSPENNLKMVQMGERTCYLHTTFREPVAADFTIGP